MYLHQETPLVHDKIWICKYCKNLLLHHLIFFNPPNAFFAFIHFKSFMPFCLFAQLVRIIKKINLFKSKFLGSFPCHCDPYENSAKIWLSSFKSSSHHDWSIVCNIHINVVSCIFINSSQGEESLVFVKQKLSSCVVRQPFKGRWVEF